MTQMQTVKSLFCLDLNFLSNFYLKFVSLSSSMFTLQKSMWYYLVIYILNYGISNYDIHFE